MHSLFIVIEFEKILLHFKIPYCFFFLFFSFNIYLFNLDIGKSTTKETFICKDEGFFAFLCLLISNCKTTSLVISVSVLYLPLILPASLCFSGAATSLPSRGDIVAALEWRLLFDIDAPLWYYMQIDWDKGGGCLMCKWWIWGTENVHTTAFLLIAFPVESWKFIRKRMNVSIQRTVFGYHTLNQWRM